MVFGPPPAPGQTQLWAARYDGGVLIDGESQPGSADFTRGNRCLAVDGDGNVYVTGQALNGWDTDVLTVKYDAAGVQQWAAVYDGGSHDHGYAVLVDGSGNVYVMANSYLGSSYDYVTVKYDASGVEQWAARYDSGRDDFPYEMALDASGNVHVTGQTADAGDTNYLTVKYDASGVQQWAAAYDGGSYDTAHALAVDGSGNVYVTGYSHNGTNFDYVTVKYDASGVEQWATPYDGGGYDTPFAVAVDSSGNVYAAGYSYLTAHGDYLTVKYNASGVEQWTARWDGSLQDWAYDLVLDGSGNAYVTGYSENGTNQDYVTVKYDTSGGEQWVARYDSAGQDLAFAVAIDGSGNVYVSGASSQGSNYSYTTVKYDSAGVKLWAKPYDGGGDDYAYAVAVDGGGNVYTTGFSFDGSSYDFLTVKYAATGTPLWTAREPAHRRGTDLLGGLIQGTVAVDGSGNVYVTGTSENGGDDDYVTLKYDAAGVEQWVARFDGGGDDSAFAVAVDGAGNVVVTGQSWDVSTWNYDYLTVKYDAAGAQQWVAEFDGGLHDFAYGLAVDGGGNAYVTGISLNDSNYDYLTVKYDASGVEQWVASYDGGDYDSAFAVAVDGGGNVYVTGESSNVSSWNYDAVTVKYDSTGVEQWVAAYDSGGDDFGYALALDGGGNPHVAGKSYDGLDNDAVTVKYDGAGSEQWAATYDGESDDQAYALAVDGSGNVLVAAHTYNGSTYDALALKYDAAGDELWAMLYDAGGNDFVNSVAVDGSGNVYLAGETWNGSSLDYLTLMYDAAGVEQWAKAYDNGSEDRAAAVAVAPGGRVVVAGDSVGLAKDLAVLVYSTSPVDDADGDGVPDASDNCPAEANAGQEDADADGAGDACDDCPLDAANDGDDDGFCADTDNCPLVANPAQLDGDADGTGDNCDVCPLDAANDGDGDGFCADVDNCPLISNPGQHDSNFDGEGDACDADAAVKVAGPFRVKLPAGYSQPGVAFVDQLPASPTTVEVDVSLFQNGPAVQFRTDDVRPAGWATLGSSTTAAEHGRARGGFLLQGRVYAYGFRPGLGQALWTPEFNTPSPYRVAVGGNASVGDDSCGVVTLPSTFGVPGITFVDQDGTAPGRQVRAYMAQGGARPLQVSVRTDDARFTANGAPASGIVLSRTGDASSDGELDGRCFSVNGRAIVIGMLVNESRRLWTPKFNNGQSSSMDYAGTGTKFPVEPVHVPGVVAHWRGQSNANDETGAHDGIALGGVAYTAGRIGQAFSFDGIDDSVDVPMAAAFDAPTEFTISFWVRPDLSNPMTVCCEGLVGLDRWGVEISEGAGTTIGANPFAHTASSGSLVLWSDANGGGRPLAAGVWTHVVAVYDGGFLRLYVDGEEQGTPQALIGAVEVGSPGSYLSIGSGDGRLLGGRNFWGRIDDVAVFSRALSPEEIQGLYQRRVGGL